MKSSDAKATCIKNEIMMFGERSPKCCSNSFGPKPTKYYTLPGLKYLTLPKVNVGIWYKMLV